MLCLLQLLISQPLVALALRIDNFSVNEQHQKQEAQIENGEYEVHREGTFFFFIPDLNDVDYFPYHACDEAKICDVKHCIRAFE